MRKIPDRQTLADEWDELVDELFALDKVEIKNLGGPGSGNFDHVGRPGQQGGSTDSKGSGRDKLWTAKEVADKHDRDPQELAKTETRIRSEATTQAERDYADELAVAELMIAKGMKNGDTFQQHTNPDGSYKADRLHLHEKIIRDFFEEHEKKYGVLPPDDLEHPVVTFMAGMPGAGKSTAAKDLQKSPNAITIDPDSVKPYLPEYAHGLGSTMIARESGDIADKVMMIAAQRRMNIVIDGTMKTSGALPATLSDGAIGKMAAFKENGYRVEVRFVDVSVNESIQNTVTRFHQQFAADGHGRYVPTSFSRLLGDAKYGTKPRAAFELAKNTSYKGQPLIDAFTHTRGYTGDDKTSHKMIESFGTLTPGGGSDQ